MQFIKDLLAEAKLAWFVTFATPVEIFLTKYQTDKPMGPFLVTDLNNMLNSLAQKIVRSTFIDSSTNKFGYPQASIKISASRNGL